MNDYQKQAAKKLYPSLMHKETESENFSAALMHYNHNHDKLGRFARSNGTSGDGSISRRDKKKIDKDLKTPEYTKSVYNPLTGWKKKKVPHKNFRRELKNKIVKETPKNKTNAAFDEYIEKSEPVTDKINEINESYYSKIDKVIEQCDSIPDSAFEEPEKLPEYSRLQREQEDRIKRNNQIYDNWRKNNPVNFDDFRSEKAAEYYQKQEEYFNKDKEYRRSEALIDQFEYLHVAGITTQRKAYETLMTDKLERERRKAVEPYEKQNQKLLDNYHKTEAKEFYDTGKKYSKEYVDATIKDLHLKDTKATRKYIEDHYDDTWFMQGADKHYKEYLPKNR